MSAAVEMGIRSKLKDPQSAVFGPMRAAKSVATGTIRVCGTVNARNSFGGYAGSVAFVANVKTVGTSFDASDSAIGSPVDGGSFAVNALCNQAGI